MRLISLTTPALAAGVVLFCSSIAVASDDILKETFDEFALDAVGIIGSEAEAGGAWRDFGKRDSSPKASDQEFFAGPGATSGKSVRIIRDDSAITTMDFWLTGVWSAPLDSGKVRVSFRVLRDSAESCFSVHLGTAEKLLNVNTIAVSVGGQSTSGEKLQVMNSDGAWKRTGTQIEVGTWSLITMIVDLSAETYSVAVNDSPVEESIPFTRAGALRSISFLPAYPDGNVSYIDDVEVVQLD